MSAVMSATIRLGPAAVCLAAVIAAGQLSPATVLADDQQQQQVLHNVTYRARADGVSRGLTITFNINDTDVDTATPTLLPGQTFEANAVLADPRHAGMEISIRWPYTANLHCEILVDDAITAQADQFIAPRLLPQSNDPGYGVMPCGGPLVNAAAVSAANNAAASAPPSPAPPSQAPPS
jgi:hypothetical protein